MKRYKMADERLNTICDRIATNTKLTQGARDAGINPATVYRTLNASREHPEEWLHSWNGDEPLPFHRNVAKAQAIGYSTLRQTALDLATHGSQSDVFFQGQRIYKLDERYIGLDRETMELLGLTERDRYLKDDQGRLVPETITNPPNATLLVAALRAVDPKFKDSSEVTHNVRGGLQVSHGVMQQQPPPRRIAEPTQPKVIEHAGKPMLDPAITDATFTEISDDATAAPTPAPAQPNTLRDDLLARAAVLRKQGPAQPTPGVYQTMAQRKALGIGKVPPLPTSNVDLDAEGIGIGSVLPGGQKMR